MSISTEQLLKKLYYHLKSDIKKEWFTDEEWADLLKLQKPKYEVWGPTYNGSFGIIGTFDSLQYALEVKKNTPNTTIKDPKGNWVG